MKISKYADDYRLENKKGKNGKLKTVPMYDGKLYEFVYPDEYGRAKKHFIGFAALIMILYIVAFLMKTVTMRRWYVTMPYAAVSFPFIFLCASIYRFAAIKTRDVELFNKHRKPKSGLIITREDHDKIYGRVAMCTFLMLFFSIASLVGGIVSAIIAKSMSSPDWVYAVCVTGTILSSLHLFLIKEFLKTEEIDKT